MPSYSSEPNKNRYGSTSNHTNSSDNGLVPSHSLDYQTLKASSVGTEVTLTALQCQKQTMPYLLQFYSTDSEELVNILNFLGASVTNEFCDRVYQALANPTAINPKDFEYCYTSSEQLSLFFEEQMILDPSSGVQSIPSVTICLSDFSKLECQLLETEESNCVAVQISYYPFSFSSSEQGASWQKMASMLDYFDVSIGLNNAIPFRVFSTQEKSVTLQTQISDRLKLSVNLLDPNSADKVHAASVQSSLRNVPSMIMMQDLTGRQCLEIFQIIGCKELETLLSTGALKHLVDVVSQDEELLPASLVKTAKDLPESIGINCRRELELGDYEPVTYDSESSLNNWSESLEFDSEELEEELEADDFEEDPNFDIDELETYPCIDIPGLTSRFGAIECRISPFAAHDCSYLIDLTKDEEEDPFNFRENQLIPTIEISFDTDQSNSELASPQQVEELWNALRKVIELVGYKEGINRIKRVCKEKRVQDHSTLVAVFGALIIEVKL